MGCFDETCCLSGLAVRHGDKVRFGLVSENSMSGLMSHACGCYNFWLPLFTGVYNDYGSVEQDKVRNKALWDWCFAKLRPFVVPEQKYHSKDKVPDDTGELIDDLIRDRLLIRSLGDDHEVRMWMCHEWAFKAVLKSKPGRGPFGRDRNAEVVKHVDLFMEMIESEQWMRERDLSWVDGVGGGFLRSHFRIEMDKDGFGELREPFRNAVIESALFVKNLFGLRKGVVPNFFQGEQHESNHELLGWTKLVAAKAVAQKKKWSQD